MTRAGKLITVEGDEAIGMFGQLLKEVEETGQHVRILRGGKIVAELRPAKRRVDPLQQHDQLKGVQFSENPTAPLDDEDWPSELR
jgi:antitoxin (DNA-binding transcriptional repressor) of toxin-antitoxin stability system